MNTRFNPKTGFLASAQRLFQYLWRQRGNDNRSSSNWDTSFICSEAPLCAELLRREHRPGD